MKKLSATIGKIIFYIFVLAVAAWTASLTLGEMKAILPNDPITPYFALALFDGGALAWLMAWTGHARGLTQRAISAIMLVICLAGVVLLSAGRLLDGGQTMVTASTSLAAAVIYGVIGATLANLVAIYAFHISDPETMEAMEAGLLSDTLRDEAMKQATANIEAEAQQLGAILAARATGQLKYNLRLPMSAHESKQIIDAQAQDITEPKPAQQQKKNEPSIISRWIAKAAHRTRTHSAPVMVPMQATTAAPGELVETKQAATADDKNHGPALDDTNPTGRQLTGA